MSSSSTHTFTVTVEGVTWSDIELAALPAVRRYFNLPARGRYAESGERIMADAVVTAEPITEGDHTVVRARVSVTR